MADIAFDMISVSQELVPSQGQLIGSSVKAPAGAPISESLAGTGPGFPEFPTPFLPLTQPQMSVESRNIIRTFLQQDKKDRRMSESFRLLNF